VGDTSAAQSECPALRLTSEDVQRVRAKEVHGSLAERGCFFGSERPLGEAALAGMVMPPLPEMPQRAATAKSARSIACRDPRVAPPTTRSSGRTFPAVTPATGVSGSSRGGHLPAQFGGRE